MEFKIEMTGIGLLNEIPFHASLKKWHLQQGDQFEVKINVVIETVRADLLPEIQTGNFTSIKSKLIKLVGPHQVRLIYQITKENGSSNCQRITSGE